MTTTRTNPEETEIDLEADCCVRCANPQHAELFDRMGISHEAFCDGVNE